MSTIYPLYDEAVQAFHRWLQSPETQTPGLRAKNLDIVNFVPRSKLEEYFAEDHRMQNLINSLLDDRHRAKVDIRYIRKHYLLSFATLLCIGRGDRICHFQHYRSLRDDKMPHKTQPDGFPILDDPTMFEDFYAKQWQFCAIDLQYDMKDRLGEHDILPITNKRKIGEGGSAIIYKIEVHKSYNFLSPTDPELGSGQVHSSTFVLKTYRGLEAEETHRLEREAYMKLRWAGEPSPNIIAFYGWFTQGDSHNLILEYADRGNLENFMMTTTPPTQPEDISLFWEKFTSVMHGIQTIHGQVGKSRSASQILNGFHQDIKPANILVVRGTGTSPYDCEFKIADLGLVRFRPTDPESSTPSDFDAFGTRAYGAPETHRSYPESQRFPLQISQAVDIWSVGCVFSEVMMWALSGAMRVEEYRRRRRREIAKKTEGEHAGEETFHWKGKILDTVTDIHKTVKKHRSDYHWITRDLLDQVICWMLKPVAGERPTAAQVFELTQEIVTYHKGHVSNYRMRLGDEGLTGVANDSNDQARSMSPPQPPPDDTPTSSIVLTDRSIKPQHIPASTSQDHESGSGRATLNASTNSLQIATPKHSTVVKRPRLTIDDGHKWKRNKKKGDLSAVLGAENLANLNGRDHIFVVDNSATMKKHRLNMEKVVSLLAYMLKDTDEDGLEIHFTQTPYKETSKRSSDISRCIYAQPYRGVSDMRGRLQGILQEHIDRFGKPIIPSKPRLGRRQPKSQPQKPLSIYVFTDAKWQPTNVGDFIIYTVERMRANNCAKEHVGFQFIRFGNDAESIARLDNLDRGLGLKDKGMDIVDHTYWDDNVWKMLLGALNDWYDDDPV